MTENIAVRATAIIDAVVLPVTLLEGPKSRHLRPLHVCLTPEPQQPYTPNSEGKWEASEVEGRPGLIHC